MARGITQTARKYTQGSADAGARKMDRKVARLLRDATHGAAQEDALDTLEPEEHYLPSARGFLDY